MSVIAVIGAGPAGSHYAGLAKKLRPEDEVHLFDAKTDIGRPIACTGILTASALGVTDLADDLVVSRIHTFRMKAPDGRSVDVKLDKENMVLDRARLDLFLVDKAVQNGVVLHKGFRFRAFTMRAKRYLIQFENGEEFEADYLVGADGPYSPVAKAAGIYGDREFLDGLQARIEGSFEPGITDVLFGMGEFGWVVAESTTIARVGVIGKDVQEDFRKIVGSARILEDQSGPVPLYNPKQVLQVGNLALIGDAATQVKATTYGGIIYGLLAGKYLAENWGTYEREFNKKLGRDLWISLKMRHAMNKFSDQDCAELIAIFEKENNRKILEKHDRDFPSKFIVQLLMKEAKLWKLGFKLLK